MKVLLRILNQMVNYRAEKITSGRPPLAHSAAANSPGAQGNKEMPTTGGPPVAGRKRLPPSGIPSTGEPPVAGMITRGRVSLPCDGKAMVAVWGCATDGFDRENRHGRTSLASDQTHAMRAH